jgi:hypothetical protein
MRIMGLSNPMELIESDPQKIWWPVSQAGAALGVPTPETATKKKRRPQASRSRIRVKRVFILFLVLNFHLNRIFSLMLNRVSSRSGLAGHLLDSQQFLRPVSSRSYFKLHIHNRLMTVAGYGNYHQGEIAWNQQRTVGMSLNPVTGTWS